ncbi:hypothetical protein DLREEDagr8_21300 [Dongia sp. agr-C8]
MGLKSIVFDNGAAPDQGHQVVFRYDLPLGFREYRQDVEGAIAQGNRGSPASELSPAVVDLQVPSQVELRGDKAVFE